MDEQDRQPATPHEKQRAGQEEAAEHRLATTVGAKARRHAAARGKGAKSVWFGMGAFGVVGWSIAVPTLIGIALGLWIDFNWPGRMSWTLALLLAGVTIGAFNAWYWISQEQRTMERQKENDHSE